MKIVAAFEYDPYSPGVPPRFVVAYEPGMCLNDGEEVPMGTPDEAMDFISDCDVTKLRFRTIEVPDSFVTEGQDGDRGWVQPGPPAS